MTGATRLDATTWLLDSGHTVTYDGTTLTIDGKAIAAAFRAPALRALLGIEPPPPPDDPAELARHGAEVWQPKREGM